MLNVTETVECEGRSCRNRNEPVFIALGATTDGIRHALYLCARCQRIRNRHSLAVLSEGRSS